MFWLARQLFPSPFWKWNISPQPSLPRCSSPPLSSLNSRGRSHLPWPWATITRKKFSWVLKLTTRSLWSFQGCALLAALALSAPAGSWLTKMRSTMTSILRLFRVEGAPLSCSLLSRPRSKTVIMFNSSTLAAQMRTVSHKRLKIFLSVSTRSVKTDWFAVESKVLCRW